MDVDVHKVFGRRQGRARIKEQRDREGAKQDRQGAQVLVRMGIPIGYSKMDKSSQIILLTKVIIFLKKVIMFLKKVIIFVKKDVIFFKKLSISNFL